MEVHRAARFAGMGLCHEGRVHLVAERDFTRRALEQKRLIREGQRIAVQQIDFHLRGARLVNERIDIEFLRLAERIHVVEHRIEFVDRGDAVGLAADFRSPRSADRRLERIVGIRVRLDEEELEFGRDNRFPAMRRNRAGA